MYLSKTNRTSWKPFGKYFVAVEQTSVQNSGIQRKSQKMEDKIKCFRVETFPEDY